MNFREVKLSPTRSTQLIPGLSVGQPTGMWLQAAAAAAAVAAVAAAAFVAAVATGGGVVVELLAVMLWLNQFARILMWLPQLQLLPVGPYVKS